MDVTSRSKYTLHNIHYFVVLTINRIQNTLFLCFICRKEEEEEEEKMRTKCPV